MSTIECPHCQASLSAMGTVPGMRVSCSTCGEPFQVPSEPPPPPPAARPQADMDRIRVNRELGRAYRAAKAARVFLVSMAVVYGLFAAFMLIVTMETRAPSPLAWAAVMVGVGATALFIVAAVRVLKEPFAWTLVAAIVASVNLAIATNIFIMVLTAGAWAAFAAVLPTSRLLKQYPDLRIAQKMRGGRRAGTETAGRRKKGRRRR